MSITIRGADERYAFTTNTAYGYRTAIVRLYLLGKQFLLGVVADGRK